MTSRIFNNHPEQPRPPDNTTSVGPAKRLINSNVPSPHPLITWCSRDNVRTANCSPAKPLTSGHSVDKSIFSGCMTPLTTGLPSIRTPYRTSLVILRLSHERAHRQGGRVKAPRHGKDGKQGWGTRKNSFPKRLALLATNKAGTSVMDNLTKTA